MKIDDIEFYQKYHDFEMDFSRYENNIVFKSTLNNPKKTIKELKDEVENFKNKIK